MRIRIISFTINGARIGEKLKKALSVEGNEADACVRSSRADPAVFSVTEESLDGWTRKAFAESDALIYIGAAGIAVRAVAPYLKDKHTDPAVVVLDEAGKFCIPILSGHVGGANALAEKAAEITGAVPVITTATDREGRFAVDVFAKEHHLICVPESLCKEVSAASAAGENIGFYSAFPIAGELPDGLELFKDGGTVPETGERKIPGPGIAVCASTGKSPFARTLFLVPRGIHIGIGCRKGTDFEVLLKALEQVMRENGIPKEAIVSVSSIDLKKEEKGICRLAEYLGVPFLTYSAEELNGAEGNFESSDFVKRTTGTDNVCERAAILAAGKGALPVMHKTVEDGVTVAAAQESFVVRFQNLRIPQKTEDVPGTESREEHHS